MILGKRVGFGREQMAPHNLTFTMIGASLLWVGWFGFNCGSNLEANGTAALVMINTFVATAAAALAWMLSEWSAKGKPSLLGLVSGAVAGLVAITPACGFSGPMGSIVLGLVAGVVCFIFCTAVKNALGYDDSLDVFGIHCIGGIIGAIATGILVAPFLGGTGLADYVSKPGELAAGEYAMATQVIAQLKARRPDAPVVRYRLGDPLQDRRHRRRPAAGRAAGARGSRRHRARRARLQLRNPGPPWLLLGGPGAKVSVSFRPEQDPERLSPMTRS